MKINNIFLFLISLLAFLLIVGCGQQVQTTPNQKQMQEKQATAEAEKSSGCDAFLSNLESCTPFTCEFQHPFTGEMMQRKIIGIDAGKCHYTEQMPNNGLMDCKYPESLRKAVVQYSKDLAAAESSSVESNIDFGSGETQTKYTIDGKEVENPLQEAIDTGVCVISGYG